MRPKRIQYADDDLLSISRLFKMRFPSILIGLGLGILLSFITSRFEDVLTKDVKVAFFIPFVVYMAAAVGAQTQSIYTRDLRSGKAEFKNYLFKEILLGFLLGIVCSLLAMLIVFLWFKSVILALTVSLGMLGAITLAPLIALLVTEVLELEHTDPAVGAGPLGTVIQDTVSVLIYGYVASWIML